MGKKKTKWTGHKRDGKPVVPVIFYAPPQIHRALKAKAKKLGTTQDAMLNAMAARNVALPKKQKAAAAVVEQAFAQ